MKLLSGLILLIAISSKLAVADAPPPSRADMEKYVALFEKFVDMVVTDKDNCPRMAADMNRFMDANAEELKKARQAGPSGQKLPKDLQDRIEAAGRRMMDGLVTCKNDKAVEAAMQRMAPRRVK
jgi:hypothetical protein